jgi:predicted ABC-type ATPase
LTLAKKELYIIAGCNGAGKTTSALTILPEIFNFTEFINADEIAKGLSPLTPDDSTIEAGKILLNKIDEFILQGKSFAFETTLSGKLYADKFVDAKKKGYKISLLFFWLPDVEIAYERVKYRVLSGGHNVELNVIKRRYYRGIENLFGLYLNIADHIVIFDNSTIPPETIFVKNKEVNVLDAKKYKHLKNSIKNR